MELFHLIADADCAEVRRRVVELGLQEQVEFRNIALSEEAAGDLTRLAGSQQVPLLSMQGALVSGKTAILEYLEQLAKDPAFQLYPQFDAIALAVWHEVMALIPAELQNQLKSIQFLIQDEISEELMQGLAEDYHDHPEELCGLYQTPLPEDGIPAQVYLFRYALLDLLDPTGIEPEVVLRQEIAITLLHEVGHHFGLSEDDLERLGYG